MISSDLNEKVVAYLENKINLSELEEWLVGHLPRFLESSNIDDTNIASAIELGLAEIADGLLTQSDLQEQLLQLTKPLDWTMTASPGLDPYTSSMSSSGQTTFDAPLILGNGFNLVKA